MAFVWDYSPEKIKKTKQGRILLLERDINYGPEKGRKISLKKVERNWDRLNLSLKAKRLMELLLWGEIRS